MVNNEPVKHAVDEPVDVKDRSDIIVCVDTVAKSSEQAPQMLTKTSFFKVLCRQWIAWVVGHGQMVRRQVSSGIFCR
jgi:hypothetical protein